MGSEDDSVSLLESNQITGDKKLSCVFPILTSPSFYPAHHLYLWDFPRFPASQFVCTMGIDLPYLVPTQVQIKSGTWYTHNVFPKASVLF